MHKELALQLYKNLFRYGQQLKYTDKSFFHRYIRNQFESSVDKESQQLETLFKVSFSSIVQLLCEFLNSIILQKGQSFLSKKRVI